MDEIKEAVETGLSKSLGVNDSEDGMAPSTLMAGGGAGYLAGQKGLSDLDRLTETARDWKNQVEEAAKRVDVPDRATSHAAGEAFEELQSGGRIPEFAESVGGSKGVGADELLKAYGRGASQSAKSTILGIPSGRFGQMGAPLITPIAGPAMAGFAWDHYNQSTGRSPQGVSNLMLEEQMRNLDFSGEAEEIIKNKDLGVEETKKMLKARGMDDVANKVDEAMAPYPKKLLDSPRSYLGKLENGLYGRLGRGLFGGMAGLGALGAGYGGYKYLSDLFDEDQPDQPESSGQQQAVKQSAKKGVESVFEKLGQSEEFDASQSLEELTLDAEPYDMGIASATDDRSRAMLSAFHGAPSAITGGLAGGAAYSALTGNTVGGDIKRIWNRPEKSYTQRLTGHLKDTGMADVLDNPSVDSLKKLKKGPLMRAAGKGALGAAGLALGLNAAKNLGAYGLGRLWAPTTDQS